MGHTHAGLAVTASRAKVTNSSVTPQLLDAPSLDLAMNTSEGGSSSIIQINKTDTQSDRPNLRVQCLNGAKVRVHYKCVSCVNPIKRRPTSTQGPPDPGEPPVQEVPL
jgi:hypothetical protein